MLKRFQAWRREESGIAIGALVILAMPLMLGAFGYGVDSARALFAKELIQGRLDIAVAAAVSAPPGAQVTAYGNYKLDPIKVPRAAIDLYITNTAKLRPALLSCLAAQIDVQSNTNQQCSGYARVVGTDTNGDGQPDPITYSEANSGLLCAKDLNQNSTRRYGVAYVVYETVPTTFLKIIGTGGMPLGRVRSEALVRAANC